MHRSRRGAGLQDEQMVWDGAAPTLVPPSTALTPWIGLQATRGGPGMGQGRPPATRDRFSNMLTQCRTVGTVKKIDRYFQRYQTGHCQASPVMPHHTPPPGSTIPVVRSDAQDSGIEDPAENMPGSAQHCNKSVLTEQELMVYKHALLCAQFPVLGSKLPGQPIPSPSQTRGASLLSSPPPSPGALSLDGDGDEEDSMVQEETLCVLVKEAFGLSEERHLFYDDHITQGLGHRAPAQLLVEELMGRLSLLQTNSHPYYQPQGFETRNAYDLWQQQEIQRISALIHRFWRGPLPNLDPLLCRVSYWTSMHHMYQDLMVLLVKHDKVLRAGPATGCPLLSSSRRLLREFSLHYGVGEIFRRIAYLEHLSSKEVFEGADWFLKHLSLVVRGIHDLLIRHQARVTLLRREFDMLCRALCDAKNQCASQAERLLQERSASSKVVSLLTLISDILELNTTLVGRIPDNLQMIISASLKESVQNSYSSYKLRQTTELRLNAYTTPVSAELIIKLIGHIQGEIQYFQEHYQQLFQLYHIEIMESAASTFYSCLMADVSVLCDKTSTQRDEDCMERQNIDPEMVAMARRLDQLDQSWKDCIPVTLQVWRKALISSTVLWFKFLIRDVQAMIVYSIIQDKFKAVHLNFLSEEENALGSSGNHHCRPSNANPLTQSIGSAFSSVVPRENPTVSNTDNIIKPKASRAHDSSASEISFTPSGVLNFKHPVRARSFPQLDELLKSNGQWSAVRESIFRGDGGTRGAAPSESPHLQSNLGDGIEESSSMHATLVHSQSFPEMSAVTSHRARTRLSPSKHPQQGAQDDQSRETQTCSQTSSRHPSSERIHDSNMEVSTDTSLGMDRARDRPVVQGSRTETLRAVFEELGLLSGEGIQQTEVTLPISSSLVDMVYMVRHTCGLMLDICGVLRPVVEASESGGATDEWSVFGQMSVELQQLMISPLQAVTFAVRLFGSNMLAMDLCATPVGDADSMINREVMNRLIITQNTGLLGSCRHEKCGLSDCNAYLARNKACLCDNFEPINPEMCLRINNVQGLLELLPDMIPPMDGLVADLGSPSSQDAERTSGDSSKMYRPLQKYLQGLLTGQIKLLAFKVNLMLSQALSVLLQLELGPCSIASRLHPLVACIHNHLVATSTWLYPHCFQLFCRELWAFMVKDFEGLVEDLLLQKKEDKAKAMLLLQTIAHLMETINNHQEHGLNADVFLEPVNGVIQILQLYTWPTDRLIQLYQWLLNRALEGTSSESWPLKKHTLRLLRRILCPEKKCFTGRAMLHALAQCLAGEEESADNVWRVAREAADRLVRCGLVRRMMASGHTVDSGAQEDQAHYSGHSQEASDQEGGGFIFPQVTIHSIPQTSVWLIPNGSVAAEDYDRISNGIPSRRPPDDSESEEEESTRSFRVFEISVEVHECPPSPDSELVQYLDSPSLLRDRVTEECHRPVATMGFSADSTGDGDYRNPEEHKGRLGAPSHQSRIPKDIESSAIVDECVTVAQGASTSTSATPDRASASLGETGLAAIDQEESISRQSTSDADLQDYKMILSTNDAAGGSLATSIINTSPDEPRRIESTSESPSTDEKGFCDRSPGKCGSFDFRLNQGESSGRVSAGPFDDLGVDVVGAACDNQERMREMSSSDIGVHVDCVHHQEAVQQNPSGGDVAAAEVPGELMADGHCDRHTNVTGDEGELSEISTTETEHATANVTPHQAGDSVHFTDGRNFGDQTNTAGNQGDIDRAAESSLGHMDSDWSEDECPSNEGKLEPKEEGPAGSSFHSHESNEAVSRDIPASEASGDNTQRSDGQEATVTSSSIVVPHGNAPDRKAHLEERDICMEARLDCTVGDNEPQRQTQIIVGSPQQHAETQCREAMSDTAVLGGSRLSDSNKMCKEFSSEHGGNQEESFTKSPLHNDRVFEKMAPDLTSPHPDFPSSSGGMEERTNILTKTSHFEEDGSDDTEHQPRDDVSSPCDFTKDNLLRTDELEATHGASHSDLPSFPHAQQRPSCKPHIFRPTLFHYDNDTTSDSSDFESAPSPRTQSPSLVPWSATRGSAFTADSQQLYCFSQVYDPIADAASQDSKQRMFESLDAPLNPELVIAIISSRDDESAKDFVHQVADEALLTKEASCIKYLCRSCFR